MHKEDLSTEKSIIKIVRAAFLAVFIIIPFMIHIPVYAADSDASDDIRPYGGGFAATGQIEDAGYTPQTLADAGMPDEVIEAVVALSHDTSVPYLDYVLGLRDKPLARAVKIADLKHNSNLSRLKKVKPSDRRRYVKYQMALALLNDSADSFDSTLDPPLWRKRIPLDEQRMCFLSVFYDATGEWRKLSLDVEESDSSYELSVTEAERLHQALDPTTSFFEALANALAAGGMGAVLGTMDRSHIPYQVFRY